MIKPLRAVVMGSMLSAPLMASASEVQTSTITHVRVRPEVVYFKLASCAYYSRIYVTNDYYKSMVALVLSAAATKSQVEVGYTNSCQTSEAIPDYVDAAY